jgi:hypothetical protein
MSLWIFVSPKRKKFVRSTIHTQMRQKILPTLTYWGFRPVRKIDVGKDRDGFPHKFFRSRDGRVDVVEFRWHKYGNPNFGIEFSMIDDHSYDGGLPADSDKRWFSCPNYFVTRRKTDWYVGFGIGIIASRLHMRYFIDKVMIDAKLRLTEMEAFMNKGPSNIYIRWPKFKKWTLSKPYSFD